MNALQDHIGHKAYLKDERHLRCVECDRTLVIAAAGPPGAASTSTSPSAPPLDQRCPIHLGFAASCGGCAADAKAAADDKPAYRAGPPGDYATGAAAARAALHARQVAKETT